MMEMTRLILLMTLVLPIIAEDARTLDKPTASMFAVKDRNGRACGCEDDQNGPVCHPLKMDYVADCAAQAECAGAPTYVACASLRTVSWRHECSCRHKWDPVCDNLGNYVAPNWECSKCLKLRAASRCADIRTRSLVPKERECECPDTLQDQDEAVCSTVTGIWIAPNACAGYCKGFKSLMPCSQMPNRRAVIPSTGLADVSIKNQTCNMVGPKVGDIAGKLGCQKVMQLCRATKARQVLQRLDGWESAKTVVPGCFSSQAKDCYEAATEWALGDEDCRTILSNNSRRCSAANARRLFGGAVSRVCGEEVRDGKPFGFWSL